MQVFFAEWLDEQQRARTRFFESSGELIVHSLFFLSSHHA